MMLPDDVKHELCQLLWVIADGSALPRDIDRLQELTDENPECWHLIARFAAMYGMLHWVGRGSEVADINRNSVTTFTTPPAAPSRSFLSPTLHGAFPTAAGYFSSDWLVAYLVATVVLAIGALIGSVIYVSNPVQVARESVPLPAPLSHRPATVGRITDMVDCKWNDEYGVMKDELRTDRSGVHHSSFIIHRSLIALGDRFTLTSGLLEITYDTGAKVILQGPCVYAVESPVGGYLSVGKLTAKLEKKVASGQWPVASDDQQASDPQSLIPNPSPAASYQPLFTIKTPTATVTDLGTEFGVEVNKEGDTTSRVFRGSVELQASPADKNEKPLVRILHATESARVESNADHAGGNRIIVSASSAEPVEFVREIPGRTAKRPNRLELIACWQFDGKNFLADSSGHGHTLVNRGATQIDGTAAFDGRAIMSTVDSIDLSPYTRVRVSWSQKATSRKADQVVWEQSENFNVTPGAIAAIQTVAGGTASIRTATDEKSPYNLDEYPVTVDTWEDFTIEYNRLTDRGDRDAYRADVVKVFKDGTLIGLNTGREGFAPDSFVNAAFYIGNAGLNIGTRAGAATGATGFTGQIDNMKIEGMLKTNGSTPNPIPAKAK